MRELLQRRQAPMHLHIVRHFWNYRIMKTNDALEALGALSHGSRLAAFRRLVRAGPSGLTVGELRDHLGLPPATLTAHLNALRAAGLVDDEREGRIIRVRANYRRMDALVDYLTENCCVDDATCTPAAACKPRKQGDRS